MVTEEIVPAEQTVIEPWTNEPATLEELLDQYVVETKICAASPGGMLYLVRAVNRSGEHVNLLEGQKYKLYFVAQMYLTSFCSFQVPLKE